MGFFSFLGRLLFASLFILSAWQMFNEFDATGGPISKELIPKLTVVRKNLSSKLGVAIPDFDVSYVRQVAATIIFLKGVGGILFVFGSTFGSFLLLSYLALATPVLYDFYNYRPNKPEYDLLRNEFIQNAALFGALLFFIGMKNSIPRKQTKYTFSRYRLHVVHPAAREYEAFGHGPNATAASMMKSLPRLDLRCDLYSPIPMIIHRESIEATQLSFTVDARSCDAL
ncbi:hypothetical protein TSUD_407020 [Trifolium subterraneum]|uniref:HR-like lesion-inducer n=1 Tax=Trifolium subterraneum TaxID=3900 RepID=A0A2Z6P0C6_TRISU|nr:hypothetical protein TSUD_407020 [Trifolium subterraneum]